MPLGGCGGLGGSRGQEQRGLLRVRKGRRAGGVLGFTDLANVTGVWG